MKLQYLNFIIEEDRNWFILSELWITPDFNKNTWEPNKNAGQEVVLDQTYPATLLRCLEKISHKIKKGNPKEFNNLQDYIKEITEINSKFTEDLKLIIK